jgi:hypothetical protein
MMMLNCFFCVSWFAAGETLDWKGGIGYTPRRGKYIILQRKQVLALQFFVSQN